MTDDERAILETRLATALDAAGIADVWDLATTCPQGHRVDWEDGYQQGDLCRTCLQQYPQLGYREALRWMVTAIASHQADPTWHPEWRIGRQPQPFTRSLDVLLPVLEAWRLQHPERIWTLYSGFNGTPAGGVCWIGDEECPGVDRDPVVALALALEAALAAPSEAEADR